ncbi:hypothetical protein [Bacillus suaedaesalsae]|uniref:Uncharacterized protein n=1 Tax=Bacillus suaedaesalsae TaxID=2810349 RepID=A0ABS2DIF9_9BACI|nr:hypothetical protein [Bacillus suaedaesalsae]MBM6618192.1 hypothetical protein [Bacillus suaedaesalsae]
MRDRWKWIFSILIFVLMINGTGIFLIHGFGEVVTKEETESTLIVNDITITIKNFGDYPANLVEEVRNEVEIATKSVLEVTKGKLIPKSNVAISLISSNEDSKIVPSYYSSVIFDPDTIWLEEWNFEEMMLYSLFPQNEDVAPFTTIGLGQYLYYSPHKGEIFDPNEMWVLHKNKQQTLQFEGLLSPILFKSSVLNNHGPSREYPKAEAHYWKIASFSHYLIEEYGIDTFVDLYESTNISKDVEQVYGKSFIALQTEWEQRIIQMEENFTPKVVQDLEYHYQYLYE